MITCGNITLMLQSQSLKCKSVQPCSWMICHVANIHYTIARHYNIVMLRRICQWLSVVRVDHHRYNCALLSQCVRLGCKLFAAGISPSSFSHAILWRGSL